MSNVKNYASFISEQMRILKGKGLAEEKVEEAFEEGLYTLEEGLFSSIKGAHRQLVKGFNDNIKQQIHPNHVHHYAKDLDNSKSLTSTMGIFKKAFNNGHTIPPPAK